MEKDKTAVFGFPDIWEQAYKAYEHIFRAIDKLAELTVKVIDATVGCQEDVQQVLRALTQVNSGGMSDVLILAGNKRGSGAMKVARSMFEVSITAEYLEKNPKASHDYLDFTYVLVWRWVQNSPGKLTASEKQRSEAEFNRVKARFTNSKGRVQNNWSARSLKEMADAIGRTALYEVIYGAGSMLHHVNPLGLIGHEADWVAEGLRIAHGSLLQTVCSLYNTSDRNEFASDFRVVTSEFAEVWK